MSGKLAGRHVLVTGAAKGMGRGIATRAAAAGVAVSLFDVDLEGARETATKAREEGADAEAYEVDVSDPESIREGVQAVAGSGGDVDGLVNNAGVQDVVSILETSTDEWHRHLETNAKGTFLCSQVVGQQMIDAGIEGDIVNIASMAAVDPGEGQGAYAASKGGVEAFTKVLAKELGHHGISANAINPGAVDTPMFRDWIEEHAEREGRDADDWVAEMEAAQFRGRIGRPEDIGELAAFLLSDEAAWITGEAFNIRGGPG